MKKTTIMLALGALLLASACDTEKVEVIKSPCASLDGGPCGPKRPLNGNYNQDSNREQHRTPEAA